MALGTLGGLMQPHRPTRAAAMGRSGRTSERLRDVMVGRMTL